MKRAVVYQACCQKQYFKMAAESARSVKRHMPDVDTVLLTDLPGESKWFDVVVRRDPVKMIDAHLPPLWLLPKYDSGFYTGCDSYICAPMYDVFELVEGDRVDIASVHTSGKRRDYIYPSCGVPKAYPHMRSALLAFQDHERTRGFFELWREMFHEHKQKYRKKMAHEGPCFPDQMVMRIALYRSNLSVAVLPPQYCCTLTDVVIRGKVRMIAAEGDLKKLAEEANKDAPHARFFQRGKATRI